MKLLDRIGYYGEKALLGVEISSLPGEPIRVIRSHFVEGRLICDETQIFQDLEGFRPYLESFPGSAIFLSIRDLELMESMLASDKGDIPSQVMGVKLENTGDFVYQKILALENCFHFSLVPKANIMPFLDRLGSLSQRVVGVNISQAPLAFFIPVMPTYEEDMPYALELNQHRYYWQGGLVEIQEHEYVAEVIYKSEISPQLKVEDEFTLLFAAMSLFYTGNISEFQGLDILYANRERLKKQQSLARVLSLGILGLIFLILMGGLAYSYLTLSGRLMEDKIRTNSLVLSKIKLQEKQLGQKNSFLIKAGQKSLRPTRISYYLDRISSISGNELQFDRLIYKPTVEILKKLGAELSKKNPDIIIQGNTLKSAGLARFGSQLEKLEFIKTVEVYESRFSFEDHLHRFIIIANLSEKN